MSGRYEREEVLQVRGLSKSFGALAALQNVSFSVRAGEVFGIAGPNGSGKSTLFNVLTKVPFAPESGEILFEGMAITHFRAEKIVRLGIARSFQKETTFESLTVFENALIGSTYGQRERGGAAIETTIRSLEFVGLRQQDFGRPSSTLSILEKKMLMLASALCMNPKVLLLDEPASGLTRQEILVIQTLIEKLREQRITILLIEHVLALLMAVSDRIMIINNGEVIVTGLPEQVVRDSRVVEAYLGASVG